MIEKEDVMEVIQIIYFCHRNSQEVKEYLKKKLQQFWAEVIAS